MSPLMDAAGSEARLYFVDVTYTGRPAHGWLRKGQTRELKSNHGRTRLNINGELSWPARELVHHEADLITSAAMLPLFDDLLARHRGTGPITIVLDNARYNRSRELRTYLAEPDCRLRLVYLPSYAPNLNVTELARGRLDLGDVHMEVADRIVLELLLRRLVAFHVR